MKRKAVLLIISFATFLYMISVPASSFWVRPLTGAKHHVIVADACVYKMGDFNEYISLYLPLSKLFEKLAASAEISDTYAPFGAYFYHFLSDGPNVWEESKSLRNGHRGAAALGAHSWLHDPYLPDYPEENPNDDSWLDAACRALGIIFHNVSDFYAHTNWVELHDRGVIADLDGQQPPPPFGWNCSSKDSPSSILHEEAYLDAVLAVIKEWYLFEDKVFSDYPGEAIDILYAMGVSSQLNVNSPKENEGYVLGDQFNITWYQTAIPHDIEAEVWLLMNGSPLGLITTVPIHNNHFNWTVGNIIGGQATPNNQQACYQIQVNTQGGQYVSQSPNFKILEPIHDAAKNVVANPYGYSMIEIRWEDGSNIEDHFEIWRKRESDPSFTWIKNVNKNSISTLDQTILMDVTYIYRVRTVFMDGYPYAESNEDSTRAPNTAPEAPENFDAEFQWDIGKVKLTWNDCSNNELDFFIERKLEYESEFVWIETVGPNVTEFIDPNTYNDTTVYYRVRAWNPVGSSVSNSDGVYVPFGQSLKIPHLKN